MSKLFVLGASGAGKTPIARQLADALGVRHVGASAWVRNAFAGMQLDPSFTSAGGGSPVDRQKVVEAMTRFSIEELRKNPRACLDVAGPEMDVPCVVEGMRNPFDFVHAFDWRTDLVVFVHRADNPLERTAFEEGLEVIGNYLSWLNKAGILDRDRVLVRTYPDVASIEAVVGEALEWVAGRIAPVAVEPRPVRVHANIAPLDVFVEKPVLFGGDTQYAGELVPCRAFAFSSYPGSAPTFKLLLQDGAIFSYVAPSVLRWKRDVSEPVLALDELTYHVCPSGDVVVSAFDALQGEHLCFFKKRDVWLKAKYAFTVDWYTGNDLVHCVLVENGQVALLPHHKIKFHRDAPGFAPYKKLRNEWRA
jgi:hypothetical protein